MFVVPPPPPAEAAADRLGVKHRATIDVGHALIVAIGLLGIAAVDICYTRILVEQDGIDRPAVLKGQAAGVQQNNSLEVRRRRAGSSGELGSAGGYRSRSTDCSSAGRLRSDTWL